MPDLWAGILAIDGLWWIVAIAFLAGVVRGFSGFGTAMIYLPVAGQFLEPVWALLTLVFMDILGPLPLVRKVWPVAHKRDLTRLIFASMLIMPIGIAVLIAVDPDIFRYAVSLIALGLVTALISGLRYHGPVSPPLVYGIGGVSGFLGGSAGLPGPPVILFYMASPHRAEVIRANTLLFLLSYDVLIITMFGAKGMISAVPLVLGLLLSIPNMLGSVIGGFIFRPGYEKTYRMVAYVIIALSAASGLPFWS